MTLTEFLLARIAEDEDVVRNVGGGHNSEGCDRCERILAECEAKRRIVERLQRVQQGETTEHAWHEQGLFEAVHFLCDVYADHPDYDEAWRV